MILLVKNRISPLKTAAVIMLLFMSLVLFGNKGEGKVRVLKTPGAEAANSDQAGKVLKSLADRLGEIKTLKFNYQRELNYSSENYQHLFAGEAFVDFASADEILRLKYQFASDDVLYVFNGSEKFELDKKKKLISIDRQPKAEDFESIPFFYNSPVTLRRTLLEIASDSSIPKKITEKTARGNGAHKFYEVIEFVLDKKTLKALGGFFPITLERKIIYRLTIDKKYLLPVEVLQTNSSNGDYIKTTFERIKTNAEAPKELTWYYSSYLSEYKEEKRSAGYNLSLIKPGQAAPDWSLPVFEADRTISLARLRGKVVLLEFWISHCGFCISAVEPLNALAEKYKNKDFKLLAVNLYDLAETIGAFKKSTRPIYEILRSGAEVARNYGVEAFPVVVLIDKRGDVIYSGSFDKKHLDDLIEKNLR